MARRRNLLALIGTIILVLSLSVPMLQCAPAAEEAGAYEEYVASLPEGCFPVPRDCYEQAIEEGELVHYNWAEWWPEEIYSGFSEEFGIKVTLDFFASNAEASAKFQLAPDLDYTVVDADTRVFWQLNEIGVPQDLNLEWIPNVRQYTLKSVLEDPECYSERWIPYTGSVTIYGYNTDYVDDPRVPSWGVLLEPDEQYSGRVVMLEEMMEVIGAALKYLGYSFNSDDENELKEAEELLLQNKKHLMAYDAWPKHILLQEEAWIAQVWSGDSWYFRSEMPNIEWVLPSEGSVWQVNGMMLPKGCSNPAVAHLFFNYLFRPQVHATLINGIGASYVHTGADPYLDQDLVKWLSVPEEYLEKCDTLSRKAFLGKGLELRSAIWEKLKM